MHDESPGGQACADRTLAYWTDQNNFSQFPSRRHARKLDSVRTANHVHNKSRQLSNTQRFGAGFLIGTILAAMIGG